jgi:hypothetical protein
VNIDGHSPPLEILRPFDIITFVSPIVLVSVSAMINIFAFVPTITLEWNVSTTMINSIDVLTVASMVVVFEEILVNRMNSFVFVSRVILVDNVNSTPNPFLSLLINSSLPIFCRINGER